MDERETQKYIRRTRGIPGWLWRLIASVCLAAIVHAKVIPWAQAQRGYPSFGGEYVLVWIAAILPLVFFRRKTASAEADRFFQQYENRKNRVKR